MFIIRTPPFTFHILLNNKYYSMRKRKATNYQIITKRERYSSYKHIMTVQYIISQAHWY